ncbi:hypothetical protein AB0P17_18900 [Streptomyces sp. NPDC088124]|uniref:hypothetical protein n=1 Tax=Streptomyces sp. NPDC088124 TaxID=3154654 RepID=UPI003419DEEA
MNTVSPPLPHPDRPAGFDQEIRALVNATAPRLFAVVEEFACENGELDARVAAWGLAYADGGGTHVTSVDGGAWLTLTSPERAAAWISRRPGSFGSLVWPGMATGGEAVC